MRPRDAASPHASDISEQLNPLHMNRITDFLDLSAFALKRKLTYEKRMRPAAADAWRSCSGSRAWAYYSGKVRDK